MNRQQYMLTSVLKVANTEFKFDGFEEIGGFFKSIINIYKQMNYSEFQSEKFTQYESELNTLVSNKQVNE